MDADLSNFGVAGNCVYAYTEKTPTLNAGLYKSCDAGFALAHSADYSIGSVQFSSTHANDGTWIYFRETDRGIMRLPLNGGSNPTLVATSSVGWAPIVDETYVYYVEGKSGVMVCGSSWTLWRALKTGKGMPETLATNMQCPLFLNMDEISLYWSTDDGRVMRLAK